MSSWDTPIYTKLAPHNRAQHVMACRKFVPKTRVAHAILHENRSLDRKWNMVNGQIASQRRKWGNVYDQAMRTFKLHQRRKEGKWKKDDEGRINGMNLVTLDRLRSRQRRLRKDSLDRRRSVLPAIPAKEEKEKQEGEEPPAEVLKIDIPRTSPPPPQEIEVTFAKDVEVIYKTPRYDMSDGAPKQKKHVTTRGPVLPVFEFKAPEINIMHVERQTCVQAIPSHLVLRKNDVMRHWDYCGKELLEKGAASKDPRFTEMDRFIRDANHEGKGLEHSLEEPSFVISIRNMAPPPVKRSEKSEDVPQPRKEEEETEILCHEKERPLPPLKESRLSRAHGRTSINNMLTMRTESGPESSLSDRVIGRFKNMSMLELSKSTTINVPTS